MARARFNKQPAVVFAEGTSTPLNSQNTAFRRDRRSDVPAGARHLRYTDILRGWVAQPILWATGYRLGVTAATVIHSPHGLQVALKSVVPMNLTGHRVFGLCEAVAVPGEPI